MFDVLVLGFSSIVARRVLPALAGLRCVGKIHIASRSALGRNVAFDENRVRLWADYQEALAQTRPTLTYISLPNSLHAHWVRQALEAGSHVVVDKPACTSLSDAEALAALAARHSLCLAEATVWNYHPQFTTFAQRRLEGDQPVTRVHATFSFPPLPRENFRNDARLGGGCLFNLGPYAAACGRYFFGEPPREVLARVTARQAEDGLETAFSLLATYPRGGALTGHFGFDTEYRNTLSVLGPAFSVEFNRAFTLPADAAVDFSWRSRNQSSQVACAAGDSFALFLESVMDSIVRRNFGGFASALLQDAQFIHHLRKSAGAIT